MVRAVGAVSERLHTVNSAREDTLRAVTRALRDRQTVVLCMPLDVQHAPLATNLPPLELPPAPGRLHPDPRAVARLADALARAKRPLILGGRGAVISDAEAALVALADRVGALLGDVGVRPRAVCRQSLVGRHQRRLFLAGRRRTDFRKRFHSRLRRQPDAVDDQERQADRARRRGGAGRYRRAETRLSDAGADRRARRRQGDGGGVAGGARAARRGKVKERAPQRRHARAHPRWRQSSLSVAGRIERSSSSIRAP